MQVYSNQARIPLSVAAYLATDHYDYVPEAVSATALLKPIRQQILSKRVPAEHAVIDLTSVIKSRLGTSIHNGIEEVWTKGHYKDAMRLLGYSEQVIERIRVNPDPAELKPTDVPVYLEQRHFRTLDGQLISGKFDLVAEGRLEDVKSTSTFTWVNDTKTEDYQLQGSIYRWLAPEIITQEVMAIQFFFMDWMAYRAKEPNYPSNQTEELVIPLLSLDDTEQFIRGKLRQFQMYHDRPEEEIPHCTDKELWRRDTVWKYYKNPAKRTRSTRTLDNPKEAHDLLAKDGHVGVVVEVPGEVVACKYCPAFPVCTQKDQYIADGTLKIDNQ